MKAELIERCISTKNSEAVIDAIVETLAAHSPQPQMSLNQLEDFQFLVRHDFSSLECKNVNETRAQLMFKIRRPDGGFDTRKVEVSMDELRQIKKELVRIDETLS